MKIEDQVCSLESAKRLKELGCVQESLFEWVENPVEIRIIYVNGKSSELLKSLTGNQHYSAYTTAELGEMLPANIRGFYFRYQKEDYKLHDIGYWELGHEDERRFDHFIADTEAEARAKALIYLIENGIVEVKK